MQLETSSTKVTCSHIPTISCIYTECSPFRSLASHNPVEIKAISRFRFGVAAVDTGIAI
jgi:hypothetical protein